TLQLAVRLPLGKPSSLTVPERTTPEGGVTVSFGMAVITGALLTGLVTVNLTPFEVAEPTLTRTLPVAAPDGTLTVKTVELAVNAGTTSVPPSTLLNLTKSSEAVGENPDPEIVTIVPTGPLFGRRLDIFTFVTVAANTVKCVTSADAVRPDGSTAATNSLG